MAEQGCVKCGTSYGERMWFVFGGTVCLALMNLRQESAADYMCPAIFLVPIYLNSFGVN